MAGHWTQKFSFVTGAVRYNDLGYLVMQDDGVDPNEIQHSHFVEWDNGNWGDGGGNDWSTVAMSICKTPIEQMIALSPQGNIKLVGSGDMHDEKIQTAQGSPENRGLLRCVRGIGDKAYVAGMNRQVYRRDDANVWTCIDQGMKPKEGEVVGFESIDGFDENDIYAVGWEGEVWHFNGKIWTQKDSPTNLILTDVCCAGDGNVYACSRMGLLLRGRNDNWEAIQNDDFSEDLWSLAWFDDQLYLSSMNGVFVLKDDQIEPIDMGDDQPATCYHLSARDGVLWSIGRKDVMAFDGKQWTRID